MSMQNSPNNSGPQTQLTIFFTSGPLAGQALPITKIETHIGSDSQANDLVLTDPSLRPEHARIVSDSNRYIIQRRDAQSLLLVNAQSLEYAILQDGDQVTLGQPGLSFSVQIVSLSSQIGSQPSLPSQAVSQFSQPLQAVSQFSQPLQAVSPFSQSSGPLPPPIVPTPEPPQAQFTYAPEPQAQFGYAPEPGQPAQFQAAPTFQAQPQMQFPHVAPAAQMEMLIPQPPPQVSYSETTRYLAAAAHLDENVNRQILQTIIQEEHRVPGESYGVDIIPVLKVASSTRKQTFIRDVILAVLLLLAIVTIVYSFVPFFSFLHTASSTSSTPTSPYGPLTANPLSLIYAAILSAFSLIALISLFFYALVVLVVSLIVRFFSPRAHLGPVFFLVFLAFFWYTIPFFLLAWLTTAIERALRHYGSSASLLTRNAFNPASLPYFLDSQIEQKARTIFPPQDGNLVVYSGNTPFSGSGLNIGGWSLPIDITREKNNGSTPLKTRPFQLDEIYTYVTDALKDFDHENKTDLCGTVTFADKLYVNGREIRGDLRFLNQPFSRPYTQISDPLIEQFMLAPTQNVRFYKRITLTSAHEETILSIFYRFTMIANSLYIEAHYLLLPPLKPSYYQIDSYPFATLPQKISDIVLHSFFPAIRLWLNSPVSVFTYLFANSLNTRNQQRLNHEIKDNATFDYGSPTSLRQLVSASSSNRPFQNLDTEMSIKLIERQILDSIREFLESRNIDTSSISIPPIQPLP